MFDTTTAQVGFWIERWNEGDARARDELFRFAEARLRKMVRRMLGDWTSLRPAADTDLVLQEASLRLLKALDKFTVDSPRAFFYLASRHMRFVLCDLWRERNRREAPIPFSQLDAGSRPALDQPTRGSDAPDKLAAWDEIHEWIGGLPETTRVLFDLLWYQGLAQREVADILGKSEQTVCLLWQRAREALARRFGGEGPF